MSSEIRRVYSKVKASYLSKLTNEVIKVEGDWAAGVSKDEVNNDNLLHAIEVLDIQSDVKHSETDVTLMEMSLVRASRSEGKSENQ